MKEEHEYQYKLELKALEKQKILGLQKIICPSCGESVPAEYINIQDKIAKKNILRLKIGKCSENPHERDCSVKCVSAEAFL